MKISIIVPVYNEEDNIDSAVRALTENLKHFDYEIIFVNDGSTDNSRQKIESHAQLNKQVKLISYEPNIGRGYALRKGIAKASGDIIITIDADLSYHPKYIPTFINYLKNNENTDIVCSSPYMKGGKVVGVNTQRLIISKLANKFLSIIMPIKLATYTSIFRAYRKDAIKSLNLESHDKDIHLEIISKASTFDYRIVELPVELRARMHGKSKTKLSSTISSHILFSFFEKPSTYFGAIGFILILLGLISGGYLVFLWQIKALNPNRPLINITVILILSGVQLFIFGIIASLFTLLKKEMTALQKNIYFLSKRDES